MKRGVLEEPGRDRDEIARARVVRFPSRAPGGEGRAGNARHEVDALDPESLRDLVGLELAIDGQRRAHGLRVRSRVVGHRGRAARGGEGKGKRGAIERQRRFPCVRTRSREAGTRARTTCRAYLPSNETCRCAEPLSGAAVSARSARAPGQARRVQNVGTRSAVSIERPGVLGIGVPAGKCEMPSRLEKISLDTKRYRLSVAETEVQCPRQLAFRGAIKRARKELGTQQKRR